MKTFLFYVEKIKSVLALLNFKSISREFSMLPNFTKQLNILVKLFEQNLVFNSLTHCLGPRKLLHSGKVSKSAV